VTNKQLAELIRETRPEPPAGFDKKSDLHLLRLFREEKAMKKRYKFTSILAAAVLITMLLAGAAFAASGLKLFDSLFGSTAKPDAAELIKTNIADARDELITLRVEEAVYDGKTIGLVLCASPVNSEQDAVLYSVWMLHDDLNEAYDTEYTQTGTGEGYYKLLGRKDGKRMLTLRLSASVGGEELDEESAEVKALENGSLRVWLEYSLPAGKADKTIELALSGSAAPYNTAPDSMLPEIRFRLSKKSDEETFVLNPVSGNLTGRAAVTEGFITYANLMGYLEIGYEYIPAPDESMGIDWFVFLEDGTRLDTASGETSHLVENSYKQISQIASDWEVPEYIYLRAKVIGEDRYLTTVKCALEKTEEVRLPDLLSESKTSSPIGLILAPAGSWTGQHVTLLEGGIREGGNITLAFTYAGKREDAARIKTVFRSADGEIVRNAVTSSGVIKDGWYELNQSVDGSMWPYPLVIDFMLDGMVTDTFTCYTDPIIKGDLSPEEAYASYPLPAKINSGCVFSGEGDKHFHTRPGCVKNAAPVCTTQFNAENKGQTPCPLCCES